MPRFEVDTHYGLFAALSREIEEALDAISYEQFKEMVTVSRVHDSIFIFSFPFSEMAAASFLKMQEHYESPHFRGKIFTKEEFEEWYRKNQSSRYDFSYYVDWSGFNIPSTFCAPFVRGDFAPYAPHENNMRRLIAEHTAGCATYYLIGMGRDDESKELSVKEHELCHAMFATDPTYREAARACLRGLEREKVYKKFKAMGYHSDVLEDEYHAYLCESPEFIATILGLDELPLKFQEAHNRLSTLIREFIPDLESLP